MLFSIHIIVSASKRTPSPLLIFSLQNSSHPCVSLSPCSSKRKAQWQPEKTKGGGRDTFTNLSPTNLLSLMSSSSSICWGHRWCIMKPLFSKKILSPPTAILPLHLFSIYIERQQPWSKLRQFSATWKERGEVADIGEREMIRWGKEAHRGIREKIGRKGLCGGTGDEAVGQRRRGEI